MDWTQEKLTVGIGSKWAAHLLQKGRLAKVSPVFALCSLPECPWLMPSKGKLPAQMLRGSGLNRDMNSA